MARIAVHTIVKNGADYVGECLLSVLPYVDIVRVSVDSYSTDGTLKILRYLESRYCNLNVDYYTAPIPAEDLVRVRNRQIRQSKHDDWIWILDDDEYYPPPQVRSIVKRLRGETEYNVFKIPSWFLYDNDRYFSKRSVCATRVFRNVSGLEWKGNWGREILVDSSLAERMKAHYIHFSYLKSSSWRKDFGASYNVSMDQGVNPLPQRIKNEVEKLYEKREERKKMQDVWWAEVQARNRFWDESFGQQFN